MSQSEKLPMTVSNIAMKPDGYPGMAERESAELMVPDVRHRPRQISDMQQIKHFLSFPFATVYFSPS
jgi:hypothetical protein